MFIKIIKAKWHWYLLLTSFGILSTTLLIQGYIKHVPTISTVSSASWLIFVIMLLIALFKQDLVQEKSDISEQLSQENTLIPNFKKYSDLSKAEKIFSILTNICIVILALLVLVSILNKNNEAAPIYDSKYLFFNDISSILLAFMYSLYCAKSILNIRFKILTIIMAILLIFSIIFFFMSTNYYPETF